jgi:hypothetical protein
MRLITSLLALLNREAFLTTSLFGSQLILNDNHFISDHAKYQEASSQTDISKQLTLDEAIVKIQNDTPKDFLSAIKESGNCFLYRGEDLSSILAMDNNVDKSCVFMTPEPDLLLPGTYSDDGALIYFQNLEKCLKRKEQIMSNEGKSFSTISKPSNAHIGTADISEAKQWGKAVSVWPCGVSLSYCFPNSRKNFFDENMNNFSINERRTMSFLNQNTCNDSLSFDCNLEFALSKGKEVMFSTTNKFGNISSSFISIPAEFDDQLRSKLFSD